MATSTKAYIDATVFITACLDEGAAGSKARTILRQIQDGSIEAYSSVLTLDEVYYKILKLGSRDDASAFCEVLMSMRNLKLIEATSLVWSDALHTLRYGKLLPRDAIHLASMKSAKVSTIISDDTDFDKIPGIKRVTKI